MYTIQTQIEDVTPDANGNIESTIYSNPIISRQYYKPSKQDRMKTDINERPMFQGSYQIMVFGGASDNSESPGERPNPNAQTETFDMNAWNDFMEPILTGLGMQSPTKYEPLTLEELVNDKIEELKRKSENLEKETKNANSSENNTWVNYPKPGIKNKSVVNFGPTNYEKINDSTWKETSKPATDTSPVWNGYKAKLE